MLPTVLSWEQGIVMLEQVLEGLSFASAMALGCSAFLTPTKYP